jgi:hypothetical protein
MAQSDATGPPTAAGEPCSNSEEFLRMAGIPENDEN